MGFHVHLKLGCLLFSESEVTVLFSVADLFSLSLPFRPTASQTDSGYSFFSHFRSSSFRWKNSFTIISISFCESKCGGVPCSCVDSV